MADQKIHVLLVDDEVSLTDFLRIELEFEGYQITVAKNGSGALIAARTEPAPDLLVLDWNLPDFTGLDICRRLRSTGVKTPILMLTGNDDVSDRVQALDAGVDDYLVKPFSIEELLARLRALQRRTLAFGSGADLELLRVGDLIVNTANRDVARGGRPIQLSVKEYQLLVYLMNKPNRVHQRQTIMTGVWGENFYGDDNLLDVYIRYLRQKIEADGCPVLIHTVRGVGFMMREGS